MFIISIFTAANRFFVAVTQKMESDFAKFKEQAETKKALKKKKDQEGCVSGYMDRFIQKRDTIKPSIQRQNPIKPPAKALPPKNLDSDIQKFFTSNKGLKSKMIFKNGKILNTSLNTIACTICCIDEKMCMGVQAEIRNKIDGLFKFFEDKAKEGSVCVGNPLFYKPKRGKNVILVPIKRELKDKMDIDNIGYCLSRLAQKIQEEHISQIAIPSIGCEPGQLKWDQVKPLILKHLGFLDITIEVYTREKIKRG
jgi:hypothetical protein